MSTATIDHITARQPQRAPQEEPLIEAKEASPLQFSDQAFALWARMDDGSWFLAIIDPDPPEDADV